MLTDTPNHELPPGFSSVLDIVDVCTADRFINFVGLVTDARAPTSTRGSDWTFRLQLYDMSVQWDTLHVEYTIFLPKDEMPNPRLGDVVLLEGVKVQYRSGEKSLLHNRATRFWVFAEDKMPPRGHDPSVAIRPEGRYSKLAPPKQSVLNYVSRFFHDIDKDRLPEPEQFESRKLQSLNVKEKDCDLKDVTDQKFCNIVANVIKDPYDNGSNTTLWVSDFTEHPNFYDFPQDEPAPGSTDCQDGDPHGHLNKFRNGTQTEHTKSWPGPYGKRCIQITAWDGQAAAIAEQKIGAGAWVSIKNLQIAWGRNNSNLEGKLRSNEGKVLICELNPSVLVGREGERLKAALRRKRDYQQTLGAEKKVIARAISDAAAAGSKRGAATALEAPAAKKPPASRRNRTQRRRDERAAMYFSRNESEAPPVPSVASNQGVACEHYNKTTSTVGEMTAPVYETVDMGELGKVNVRLPFINVTYRACVRVVDFCPPLLEDFCRRKKPGRASEYDALSDNDDAPASSGSSSSESDSDTEHPASGHWEFHFSLKLADAKDSRGESGDMWVQVNDAGAQHLTGLNAVDLRQDAATLERLRQTLFQLWGNLEEVKLRHRKPAAAKQTAAGQEPPPDSSAEGPAEREGADAPRKVQNVPFACCLRQYGVREAEQDPSMCDAGPRKRWKRCFMLHGTKIKNA